MRIGPFLLKACRVCVRTSNTPNKDLLVGFTSCSDRFNPSRLEHSFWKFGKLMKDVEEFQKQLVRPEKFTETERQQILTVFKLEQIDLLLVKPAEEFTDDVNQIKDLSRKFDSMSLRYNQCLEKYSSTPRTSSRYTAVSRPGNSTIFRLHKGIPKILFSRWLKNCPSPERNSGTAPSTTF